ncbi:glycosyltransferase family 4 protein [Limosilactobacillus fermentum]
MIISFQVSVHNIKILQSLGAEVHVGTNFLNPGTITTDNSKKLVSRLEDMEVKWHQVDFMRGIGNPKANKQALKQICTIIRNEAITGIHAHSPLGGIIGRRAAHKMHVKIIYTAHGLQFFKGGPLKDWLLFFPVEWFYAHWTDALVTINKQDFSVKSKMLV